MGAFYSQNKKNKLIFDGYPRSVSQAKNLESMMNESNQKIDFIFFLNVSKDTIISRIEKRNGTGYGKTRLSGYTTKSETY